MAANAEETGGKKGEEFQAVANGLCAGFKPECLTKAISILTKEAAAEMFPSTDSDQRIAEDLMRKVVSVMSSDRNSFTTHQSAFLSLLEVLLVSKHNINHWKGLINMQNELFKDVKEAIVKDNLQLFKGGVEKIEAILGNSAVDAEFFAPVLKDYLVQVLDPACGKLKEQSKIWAKLVICCVQTRKGGLVKAAKSVLCKRASSMDWKVAVEEAKQILILLKHVEDLNDEVDEMLIDAYKMFLQQFLQQLKKAKILDDVNDLLVEYVLICLDSRSTKLVDLGSSCLDYLKFKRNKGEIIKTVLEKLDRLLKDDNYPWDDLYSSGVVCSLLQKIMEAYDDGRQFMFDDLMISISCTSMMHREMDIFSIYGIIYLSVTTVYIQKHERSNTLKVAVPLLGGIINNLEHENDTFQSIAGNQVMMFAMKEPQAFIDFTDKLIEAYLNNDSLGSSLLTALDYIYIKNPEPIEERFEEIIDKIESGDSGQRGLLYMLLQKIANRKPELFKASHINLMMDNGLNDPINPYQVLQILKPLAEKMPHVFEPRLKEFTDVMKQLPMTSYYIKDILVTVSLQINEVSEFVMDTFTECLKTFAGDQNLVFSFLDGIKSIGVKKKNLLEKHKQHLEHLKETSISNVKEISGSILDIIEGRSLSSLSIKVEHQQQEIDDLEVKVEDTEGDVTLLTNLVNKQQVVTDTLHIDVNEAGQRLDNIEETVQETMEKVEEIDQKTLGHAPFWSRDVTKLLNLEAEHDWRLLASRLGYTSDDIRGWAGHSDPCMALLNEWYTTHKMSEANFSILQALQEMNRLDAAVIVENAMKAVEGVVEDELFEYQLPPPIFLSYQWSHQDKVKIIGKHLQLAGYECWLDVGQMGGGDKLFTKIDEGIRAAKVIICCVTKKYAKSPNCNREVNLSVTLGKPIIPLLLESLSWPPPGSMGPIFSEYLYIRFFQRAKPSSLVMEKFWADDKMQELLMQLNFLRVMPDEEKVSKEYKNWWKPVAEEIIIDHKKKAKVDGAEKTETETEEGQHQMPSVFLSYQWARQQQVKQLYKQLTQMGYTCWMDIHQMGGGDSLYNKIDQGIRGCSVLLSCITQKYTLSANCRREVSLADAIKKPIIPLLLENLTWPPGGPMSMVFTELLYINFFSSSDAVEIWSGESFEGLVEKIQLYVTCGKEQPEISEPADATDQIGSVKKVLKKKKRKATKSMPQNDVKFSHDGILKSKRCAVL